MKSKELTKLNILVAVLKNNYSDYYEKHIGHDFLDDLDVHKNSDSISYLMEHVRKLKPTDKEYSDYLKHCYAIFLELQHLVKVELEEAEQNHIQLIKRSFTTKSVDRLMLLDLAVNDPFSMDKFCEDVKKDKKEFLSSVIINLVESYKLFKKEKTRKLDRINYFTNYFAKCFNDLTN
jgi:hypothetical protein